MVATADIANSDAPKGAIAPVTIVARRGLHRRLLAAFIGLSLLVVIAAVIAFLSLWLNQKSHDRISSQSIPIATTSLDLTRRAQRIVDAVPDLVAAGSAEVQNEITADLGAEVDELNNLLEQMRNYDIDPRAAASIDRAAQQFSANIGAINRVVSARLAIANSFDAQIIAGQAAVEAILAKIEPLATKVESGLDRVLASDPEIAAQKIRLLNALSAARELTFLLSVFADLEPDNAARRSDRTFPLILAVIDDIPPELRTAYQQNLDTLSSILFGSNSLTRVKAFEGQLVAAAEQALAENADLARRFAAAVDRLINAAKADVASANAIAVGVQRTAFWLLSSVVVANLIFSFLIVRYYVQRNILARLTALTSSMMSIANGDLSATLPEESNDELGSMAMALRVFRDTAVEVRDSNLREIQETRSRLSHAIENIQEGFALFNSDDALILCNLQFGTLLFHSGDDSVIGRDYSDLMKDLVDRGFIELGASSDSDWLAATLAYHSAPTGTQIWHLKDDRWVGTTERRTDDGGTVMVISDITAIKQHEHELDQLVEELRKASAAKSSFLANVSHELRTPLTAVLGFAQIVQNRLENVIFPKIDDTDRASARALSQVRENITIMIKEGQRLTKMINDILDLEKIEAGQMVWDIEPTDIGSVIRQAAASTKSLYERKNLEMHINVGDDLPMISGDRDRLVQVVINLISNAVKFTERGHVACAAKRGSGNFVSVSISDSGIGITPEDQLEVFDKFRQVGDTLTEKPSGTGLGLPICREIVEHLGGSITVESLHGYGSTFTFQLPIAQAGAAPICTKGNLSAQENSHS